MASSSTHTRRRGTGSLNAKPHHVIGTADHFGAVAVPYTDEEFVVFITNSKFRTAMHFDRNEAEMLLQQLAHLLNYKL